MVLLKVCFKKLESETICHKKKRNIIDIFIHHIIIEAKKVQPKSKEKQQ